MVVIMSLRDDLYQKFGPLLLEAMFDFQLEIANELRKEQGMPIITKDQYMALLANHITKLEPYDWMKDEGKS